MSKQNKFRVWSPSENKYLVEPRLALSLLNSAPFVGTIASFDGDIEWFTGLLDKNGKEIYQGDVTKVSGFNEPMEIRFGNWDDSMNMCYGIGFYAFGQEWGGRALDSGQGIEVIGNIHENL